MSMIQVTGLHKHYGAHQALAGVDFTVNKGQIVGFLGPNGAGKSTTMKILTGYLSPTAGQARICGVDVLEDPVEARRHVGYLPESAPVYTDMRVADYLDFIGEVRGLERGERAAAVARAMQRCGLDDRARDNIGTLSKGYRQRVGLAQAILHEPDILILDEPTSGLDPNQILGIRALIRELGQQHTVILSTHILSEVQATCDRVIIIHRGRIAADGPTAMITARTQGELTCAVLAPGSVRLTEAQVLEALRGLPGVNEVVPVTEAGLGDGELSVRLVSEGDVRAAVFRWAADAGLTLLELRREQSSLEDVFRRLTS